MPGYTHRAPRTIHILAFDDNDELDVIGPYEILMTAGRLLKRLGVEPPEVTIVSVPGTTADPTVVRGINGLKFGTRPLGKDEKPDLLIATGGGYDAADPPIGISKQMNNPDFTGVIAAQHDEGRRVASVCTGAFGLAGAGIVKGRTMTTHPATVDDLVKFGARVLNPDTTARVVDDGDIVSCGGVTSGTDETLYLVRTYWPEHPSLETSLRDYIDYYFYATVLKV
jgi:transcriptional regulator GlxA family with amidase domain